MFPNPLDYADLPAIRTNTLDDTPFTKEEIAIVIKNLHKGKALGPDGIGNIIIQQINKRFPILLMELLIKCLHLGTFPDPLKLGNIILFKKEGKPEDEASSYRPISLLPTIGKVLEKLLNQRSIYHLERLNKISDNQCGFREGRSTELAIHHLIQKISESKKKNPHVVVLSIDIKDASGNIQHSSIVNYLDNSHCPKNISTIFRNLLLNRKIILNSSELPAIRDQKMVWPQGSCSGPAHWNLVSNEILREIWPENTAIQAFADDFVIISHAPTKIKIGY
ncbi:putative RNA-directed DNA polymerase from transposon X-element [Araneus ventricosus]|uniref:Putative RNA-directed DNA polymerase from transposon X-element n=1 Tax=Araneus ventricosus TaxID=182803 RepID=A0A4Y2ICT9_ARAVE|nr:putative RNA-directed DNA polymerase from transposon X-element [Araneus ventricosus]